MKIPNNIKESVKTTVGYSEAANKESFLVGSNIAFDKCEKYFTARINILEQEVKTFKGIAQDFQNDMTTLVKIISKHQSLNH